MARCVRIDRNGDLSIDKRLKNPWKFSWLEEEQNIEDLLATPSSKKVYYQDFLEKINKRGLQMGCLLKYVEGWRRSETPCCHQETPEQNKIETNKLRTRRLGNTDFSFILYDVFSWTLSLLKHWQSNWNQTCILHSYTIIGNWHAVTTCSKLELKVQHGNPHLLMRSKVYLCIF